MEINNNELYKEKSVYYEQGIKQMLRALIKKTPREILIDVLVSEKIINRDWNKRDGKYKLKDGY